MTALNGIGLGMAGALAISLGVVGPVAAQSDDPLDGPPRILDQYPDVPPVDGDASDWPERGFVLGDERHLAMRFRLNQPVTITGSPGPVIVRLDTDDDSGTGKPMGRLGVDLEITFSDPTPPAEGRRRHGPSIVAHRGPGDSVDLTAYDVGLEWGPTHASEWFEVRIDRRSRLDEVLGNDGIGTTGRVWVMFEANGGPVAEPEARFLWSLVPPATASAREKTAQIPAKPESGLRVMSWNVLWGNPQRDPAPFARIFAATEPDVILFQEWDRAEQSEEQIAAWLDEHHPRTDIGAWTVERSEGWGVAVATPHPVIARGPDELFAPGTRWDFPVRYAAMAIDTPLGVLAAASVHYKCCGTVGGLEDIRRLLEAEAVNDELAAFAERVGAEMTMVGGDFNMNGTPAVAALSFEGLDRDGSALAQAMPLVLGDDVMSTFGRPDRGSTGARLDFIGYPDSLLGAANAFVIDTARLSETDLESMGLRRSDSEASDHRPVVVDLVSGFAPE